MKRENREALNQKATQYEKTQAVLAEQRAAQAARDALEKVRRDTER